MKDHHVFVVSLPRTGTTSMCKMLNILGYKAKHVPSCFFEKWVNEGYNAFADTPCFAPSFIKEHSILNPNNKFIFMEKEWNSWSKSFESVRLHESYNKLLNISNPKNLNVVILNEIKAYGEVFSFKGKYDKNFFIEKAIQHKQDVLDMLPSDRLLVYNFDMGWNSLCKFLDVEIPKDVIPSLNSAGKINEIYEN